MLFASQHAEVLALANAVSEPLRTAPGAVGVGELRAGPTAAAGDVRVALLPDVATEVGWVADAVAAQWSAAQGAAAQGSGARGSGTPSPPTRPPVHRR